MADRRRGKTKKKEEVQDKPTQEQYAVAKYLRFNLPAKEAKLVGMTVQYFIASKAVDMLMDSQWAANKAQAEPLFTSRASCVEFMHILLEKGLFHRAAKAERKKDREKKKKKKEVEVEEVSKEEDKKKKKVKKSKERTKEEKSRPVEEEKLEEKKEDQNKAEEESEKEKKDEEKKEEEKRKSKKEKKVRLEMHELQVFKDGEEYYVWIYDPVPLKTFIIGLFLVLGAIAVCLFPLWPPEVRLGVYYLSLAAAGFVGVILALCVLRLILFCIVWGVTFGKHHFWFLPNLTEDVGFFDSFKPLYKHEVLDSKPDKDKKSKEEKKEKSKESKNGKDSESENDNGYEVIDANELDDANDNPDDEGDDNDDNDDRDNDDRDNDDNVDNDIDDNDDNDDEDQDSESQESKKDK